MTQHQSAAMLLLAACTITASSQTGPTPQPFIFDTSWRGFITGTSQETDPWFPYDQTIADLDGDGDLDVATANRGNFIVHRISVLINEGGGFFAQPVHYTIADDGEAIASADFDGDGDIDLLASEDGPNNQRGSVALLRNLGDGTFGPREGILVHPSDGAIGLAVGDLDGDGDIDFASANNGRIGLGSTVSLRLNNGDGTFADGPTLNTGNGPTGVIIEDVLGSSLPEVIVATEAGPLEIFENMGDGSYQGQSLPLPLNGRNVFGHVRAADIDSDGDLDLGVVGLAIQQNTLRGVAILLNTGSGFDPAQFYPFGSGASGASQLAFGDLTGDGAVDIAAVTQAGDRWYLLPGHGDGTFGAGVERISGEYPHAVDIADMDADGDRDVVIAGELSNGVYVHDNGGSGAFAYPYEQSGGSTFDNLAIASGDVDNDGDEDVVTAGEQFNVFRNNGDGTYQPSDRYSPGGGRDCQELALRDLNGDGFLDMLWINRDETPPYNFHTAMNNGSGDFLSAVTWPIDTCGNEDIDAHDLDLDGDLDVVVTEWLGCMGDDESGRRIYIGRNNGNGTFQLLPPILLPQVQPAAVDFGDFNEDGIPDLALGTNPLSVGIGHGDFTFDFSSIGGLGIDVDVRDLNGDGHLDIVSCVVENTSFSPGAGVLLGRGDGTFSQMETYLTSFSPNLRTAVKVEIGDYDGDGILDLATCNTASHDASFLKGLGDGTFEREVRFGLGEGPIDFTTGDFNGDGVDDLAASLTMLLTQDGGGVRWLLSTGEGGCPADLDGDGDADGDDFFAYLDLFAVDDPAADLDGDGDIDADDFFAYLDLFAAGC